MGAWGPAPPPPTTPPGARRSGPPGSPRWRGTRPAVSRSSASAVSPRLTLAPWCAPGRAGGGESARGGALAARPRRRARCALQVLDPLDRCQGVGGRDREDVVVVGVGPEEEGRE